MPARSLRNLLRGRRPEDSAEAPGRLRLLSGHVVLLSERNQPTSLAEHRCAEICLMGAALLLAVALAFSTRLLRPYVEAAHVDDVYSRLLSLPASVNGAVKKRGAVPSALWELDQRQTGWCNAWRAAVVKAGSSSNIRPQNAPFG